MIAYRPRTVLAAKDIFASNRDSRIFSGLLSISAAVLCVCVCASVVGSSPCIHFIFGLVFDLPLPQCVVLISSIFNYAMPIRRGCIP